MHAHSRHPSSGHSSPSSPPSSPLSRSPRHRQSSGKSGRPASGTLAQRLTWILFSALVKRRGFFLFAPLMYISGMLFYMGTVPFDVDHLVPSIKHRSAPGTVYRSPQLYSKLRSQMDYDNSSGDAISTIWKHSYKGGEWRPCINQSMRGEPVPNGYIYIEANGGLNQQRTSICNAVAVAGYLNATLVIPHFHFHSIWRDPSTFGDVYDEEFFVKTLGNDVRIVDRIPVLPKLLEEKIIRISPFANRLSFDAPPAVQRLRCLANYLALRFSKPILTLGETLVARMKEHSANNSGKYISVHLRFEEDMVAFSCCVYDGGKQEKIDMDAARERGWRGKFTKRGRVIRPGTIRLNGKCPLTPLEVGLMLRGMGFDKSTSIYLASGRIYDSERYMAPLLEMFPLLQTKEMLASTEDLAPFQKYSSRMAAIDYTVCLHSEVFVTTQGGNFPHFLLGHRRYLYGGHSRTIRPDKRKLALLLDNLNIGGRQTAGFSERYGNSLETDLSNSSAGKQLYLLSQTWPLGNSISLDSNSVIQNSILSNNMSPFGMNLTQSPSVKLDKDNFLLWKNIIMPMVKGHNLESYLLGTKECPAQFISTQTTTDSGTTVEKVSNSEYSR
ncbi:O-fucosyltransferase family protein [Abeliophyllum distichum]|uniref:O-fucosyltransferase family protein n=1 Tax=Abeliophyllum distichum TaxID=126358 RepID=A0ABD1R994_9LAMI